MTPPHSHRHFASQKYASTHDVETQNQIIVSDCVFSCTYPGVMLVQMSVLSFWRGFLVRHPLIGNASCRTSVSLPVEESARPGKGSESAVPKQ